MLSPTHSPASAATPGADTGTVSFVTGSDNMLGRAEGTRRRGSSAEPSPGVVSCLAQPSGMPGCCAADALPAGPPSELPSMAPSRAPLRSQRLLLTVRSRLVCPTDNAARIAACLRRCKGLLSWLCLQAETGQLPAGESGASWSTVDPRFACLLFGQTADDPIVCSSELSRASENESCMLRKVGAPELIVSRHRLAGCTLEDEPSPSTSKSDGHKMALLSSLLSSISLTLLAQSMMPEICERRLLRLIKPPASASASSTSPALRSPPELRADLPSIGSCAGLVNETSGTSDRWLPLRECEAAAPSSPASPAMPALRTSHEAPEDSWIEKQPASSRSAGSTSWTSGPCVMLNVTGSALGTCITACHRWLRITLCSISRSRSGCAENSFASRLEQ
eukprot:334888-Chlamydomonas_euryale.AAC.4